MTDHKEIAESYKRIADELREQLECYKELARRVQRLRRVQKDMHMDTELQNKIEALQTHLVDEYITWLVVNDWLI